jgi:hypothetical protein
MSEYGTGQVLHVISSAVIINPLSAMNKPLIEGKWYTR